MKYVRTANYSAKENIHFMLYQITRNLCCTAQIIQNSQLISLLLIYSDIYADFKSVYIKYVLSKCSQVLIIAIFSWWNIMFVSVN